MLIIYETVIAYSLHKQITMHLIPTLFAKKYIIHKFLKISLRFPQNPTTHILFIFKQTFIIYVRHTYSVWVSPTNWGCKLQVHVQCSWNTKMKNGELFDFLPSVRNSFHAFWINDLLASVNGSTFFVSTLSYLFILLILARENICIIQCCE